MPINSPKPNQTEIGDKHRALTKANAVIPHFGALSENTTGLVGEPIAGENFVGFAEQRRDNTGGADGAMECEYLERVKRWIPVTGIVATSKNAMVYATGYTTFDLTSTTYPAVGRIKTVNLSTGLALVVAKAAYLRG